MKLRKTCPQCAEHVKAGARVCRFCGYTFEGGAASEEDPSEHRNDRARSLSKGPWVAAGALALILIVVGGTAFTLTRQDTVSESTAERGEQALGWIQDFCEAGGVDRVARLEKKRKEVKSKLLVWGNILGTRDSMRRRLHSIEVDLRQAEIEEEFAARGVGTLRRSLRADPDGQLPEQYSDEWRTLRQLVADGASALSNSACSPKDAEALDRELQATS